MAKRKKEEGISDSGNLYFDCLNRQTWDTDAKTLWDCTGSSKKNFAKFSDTCSVRADVLCIGSPRLVGGRKAGKINNAKILCSTL